MRASAFALVALVALGGAAQAAPDDNALLEAKEHYDRGMQHYELGEFTAAVEEFKQAYARSQAPGLLFNLAQASRLGKDYEQALHFYRSYLRVRPDAPNRPDVEKRIAELEPLVDAIHKRETLRLKSTPDGRSSAARATTATSFVPGASVATTAPPSGKGLRVGGIIVGVLGLGALGAGVGLGVAALDAQNKLSKLASNMGSWSASEQQLYNTGRTDAAAATGLYVAGGVAVATGVVLYVVGWRRDRARFAVAPTPGGAQAVWSCAF